MNPLCRSAKWLTALFFLSLLLAAVLLVSDGLWDNVQKSDVALVLGNKVEINGEPSARLKARLDRALALNKEGDISSVIVSGAPGKEGYDEAKVMAAYLNLNGIPMENIIIDSGGYSTRASAINTAKIMRDKNFKSILVVSQYFHISRTKLALRNEGITNIYSAHAYIFELRDLYSIPREIVGYCTYFFRHQIEVIRAFSKIV